MATRILFVVIIAAYPFAIYFGIGYLPPSFFGLLLVALLAVRYQVLLPSERPLLLPLLLVYAAYAILSAILGSAKLLLYYPALVNFSLCGVFLESLRQKNPLLLRIVKARGLPISTHGPRYLTRLTAVWAGFFVINGSVSIWTTTLTMEAWTLYNGLLAYFLVAVLAGGEYIFRRYYKRRMGVET